MKEEYLIEILMNDEFQEGLSPAFGTVPQAIARLLGRRKSEKAIIPLFQMIGGGNFDLEEEVIHALREIGPVAKAFCMKKAENSSGHDFERALIALQAFVPDEEIRECASKLLEKKLPYPPHLKEYLLSLIS